MRERAPPGESQKDGTDMYSTDGNGNSYGQTARSFDHRGDGFVLVGYSTTVVSTVVAVRYESVMCVVELLQLTVTNTVGLPAAELLWLTVAEMDVKLFLSSALDVLEGDLRWELSSAF